MSRAAYAWLCHCPTSCAVAQTVVTAGWCSARWRRAANSPSGAPKSASKSRTHQFQPSSAPGRYPLTSATGAPPEAYTTAWHGGLPGKPTSARRTSCSTARAATGARYHLTTKASATITDSCVWSTVTGRSPRASSASPSTVDGSGVRRRIRLRCQDSAPDSSARTRSVERLTAGTPSWFWHIRAPARSPPPARSPDDSP